MAWPNSSSALFWVWALALARSSWSPQSFLTSFRFYLTDDSPHAPEFVLVEPNHPLTDRQKLTTRLVISILGSYLAVTAIRTIVEAIAGS